MAESPRFPPDDPREWLNRARSNLRRAVERGEGVYLEDLCHDAQQAAEKAVKAVFIARGVRFPFVHDLELLLAALERAGQGVPPEVRHAAWLTRFATEARYPAPRPVTGSEHDRALADARSVVRWAGVEVARPGRLRERPAGPYDPRIPQRGGSPPDPALLSVVIERIVAAAAPDRIILFGSGARGDMAPESDLDFLIVKGGSWEPGEVDAAIRGALRDIGVATDLVLATPAELERYGRSIGLVYLPALEEGRVVYDAGTPRR